MSRKKGIGEGRPLKMGTCCCCGGARSVHIVVYLNRKAPTPGRGWGCITCGLPADGAIAVVCEGCNDRIGHHSIYDYLRWVCTGFPATDGRTPMAQCGGRQEHDIAKHRVQA